MGRKGRIAKQKDAENAPSSAPAPQFLPGATTPASQSRPAPTGMARSPQGPPAPPVSRQVTFDPSVQSSSSGQEPVLNPRRLKQYLKMQRTESGLLPDFDAMNLTALPVECYKFDNYAKKRYGTLGRPVELYSNYFRMRVKPKQLYHYNIEIIPVDNRPSDKGDQPAGRVVRRKKIPKEVNFVVFDQLWQVNRDVFKSEPVFDGEKNIYTTESLNFSGYERVFKVTIVEAGDRKSDFKVRITTPDDSHVVHLEKIQQATSTDFKVSETQALDIILKNGPRRFKLSIGMNLFLKTADLRRLDPNRQQQIRAYLGENKEMAYGFYQSARMTEDGLMLNLDRAAIVFNQGGSVISIIEKLLSESRSTYRETVKVRVDASLRMEPFERKMLETEIKGLKVQISHIPYKPKFSVHRFSHEPINRVFFEETNRDDGSTKRTSVFDYFNRTYADWLRNNRITLNPNLPAIQIGRDRPKYFPMEVCYVIDDQHSTKKLKAKLQAEMTRRAGQQNPKQRFQEIVANLQSVIRDNKENGKAYLDKFGVEINNNFVKVNSRILPQPNLQYRGKPFDPGNQGQWDMSRSRIQFLSSPKLGSNWAIVNVAVGRGRLGGCRMESLCEFSKGLIGKGQEYGLEMSQPCCIEQSFMYNGRGSFQDFFENFLKRFPQLKILIFFIPKQDEIYHELKTVAELRKGLVTQCVSQDNEKKCTSPAFVGNVMLKINAKVQGVNTVLAPQSKPILLTKCAMIVGLDVTHPAPADKLSQSIAACVGTYDRDFTKYHARVVVQPKPKKEIVDLAAMMKDLLDRFFNVNKRLPAYIIIYRDGVSEGQFDEVMVKELAKLKEAFKMYEDGKYDPKVMFMVVQKRNHTRFMAVQDRDASRNGNVQPGTVVDRTITSNVLFDFYIVAHAGMIGTSRPVHYYVLYDEIGVPADEIQKMTYYLSYLYPRCTKSISVPPPVMYAHLSAKRARSHIFIVDDADAQSTVSSGSSGQYRQLSEHETEVLNKKLMVQPNLNGVLYYI